MRPGCRSPPIITSLRRLALAGAAAFLVQGSGLAAEPEADAAATEQAAKWRFSAGFQATKHWASAYSGFTRPLNGKLYETGFFLRSTGGGGIYRYDRTKIPRERITGVASFSDITVGWQSIDGPLAYSLALGLNVSSHTLSAYDPGNRVQGARIGLKAEATLHYRFADLWAVSGHASYAAAFTSWSARLALMHSFSYADLGFEAAGLGNRGSRTLQLGPVAEKSLGRLFLRASGGLSLSGSGRPSPYATVNAGYTF